MWKSELSLYAVCCMYVIRMQYAICQLYTTHLCTINNFKSIDGNHCFKNTNESEKNTDFCLVTFSYRLQLGFITRMQIRDTIRDTSQTVSSKKSLADHNAYWFDLSVRACPCTNFYPGIDLTRSFRFENTVRSFKLYFANKSVRESCPGENTKF